MQTDYMFKSKALLQQLINNYTNLKGPQKSVFQVAYT